MDSSKWGFINKIRAIFAGKDMQKRILAGVVSANAVELGGAIGAWYTFRDKPYAGDVAMYQITNTAVLSSVVGVLMPLLTTAFQSTVGNHGGNGGAKHNNNKKNRGNKGGK